MTKAKSSRDVCSVLRRTRSAADATHQESTNTHPAAPTPPRPAPPCPTARGRMTSYNPELGLRGLSVPVSPRGAGTRCDIEVDEAVGAPARYRYMYTPLEERAASLEKGLLSLQVCPLPCPILSHRALYRTLQVCRGVAVEDMVNGRDGKREGENGHLMCFALRKNSNSCFFQTTVAVTKTHEALA